MSLSIRFMKQVDAIIGQMMASVLPRVIPAEFSGEPASVLIIRPGGIGDAVLLIPAIIALKQRFPGCGITILAETRNAGAFKLCSHIDKVLRYNRPRDLLAAMGGSYDLVIDSEQWHRLSAVIARLTGAKFSIGFGTNQRARLFSQQINYSHDDYERDSFLHLLAPLGINTFQAPRRFLELPVDAEATVAKLLEPYKNHPFVCLFPGASIAERRWDVKKIAAVAHALESLGITVVIIGGRDDQSIGEQILTGCAGLNLAGRTSLAETAAVIDRSELLVSGDSGVLHIAVGLDKPTVSLFGPGIQNKWGPQGDNHITINKNFPCSPCTEFGTTPPCPHAARCITEISVDEVFNAVTVLLTKADQ